MALINCPECNREISDTVEVCPHCGYRLAHEPLQSYEAAVTVDETVSAIKDAPNASNNPELIIGSDANSPDYGPQSVNYVQQPKKVNKVLVLGGVLFFIVAVSLALFFVVQQSQKKAAETLRITTYNQYVDNLSLIRMQMLSGAADAENMGNLIKSVWYDAIHEEYSSETAPYTCPDGKFVDDFNEALGNLYADPDFSQKVTLLKSHQDDVAVLMKELNNPTDEFDTVHETVDSLYVSYKGLTNLAISPTGSYNSFSDDFRRYDSDFMLYYDKMEIQIPEKIPE